jgi:hypothetical protein
MSEQQYEPLTVSVTHWAPARVAYKQFVQAHPELGLKYTETAYARFMRLRGPALVAAGVCRKAGLRSPAVVDMRQFDRVAFDLLSRNPLGADAELLANRE